MRLCRFDNGRLGIVEGDNLRDVTAALDVLPAYRYPLPSCDPLIQNLTAVAARIRTLLPTAPTLPLSAATLLSPVANPGKVIAAPVNYQKHLDEVRGDADLHHQNPINTIHKAGLFLKATSALAGAGEGDRAQEARTAQRSRDRAGVRHRQDRAECLEGRGARLRRRLRHRPRHHDSRAGRAEPSQVCRQLRDPRPVAGHGRRDPRSWRRST